MRPRARPGAVTARATAASALTIQSDPPPSADHVFVARLYRAMLFALTPPGEPGGHHLAPLEAGGGNLSHPGHAEADQVFREALVDHQLQKVAEGGAEVGVQVAE